MIKLKVKSEKLKVRKAGKLVWVMKLFALFFLCMFLFASCSKVYKPIGVKKHKKKNCDCSRWSYNEPLESPTGTGGSSDADLYILDIV